MKIYTKTGDTGETSLFGGRRVRKDSLRIEAYGDVDELNSHLGVIRSLGAGKTLDRVLASLQDVLFVLGADLAAPQEGQSKKIPRIAGKHVEDLEQTIDVLEKDLRPLKAFVLPAGSVLASQLHVARAICRRAERATVALAKAEPIGGFPVMFLNRLSDLLFVMARYANADAEVGETEWHAPRST